MMSVNVELQPEPNVQTEQEVALQDLEKELVSVEYYETSTPKKSLAIVLCVFTCGIGAIALYWSRARVYFTCRPSTWLAANRVLVKLKDGREELCVVERFNLGNEEVRFYTCHSVRFIYREPHAHFRSLQAYPLDPSEELCVAQAVAAAGKIPVGLEDDVRTERSMLYGPNSMDIKVKPYWQRLLLEAIQPFYIFQYFSVALWCYELYYEYAVLIFIITAFSVIFTTIIIHKEALRLANMAKEVSEVQMVVSSSIVKVSSEILVPGDIVVISEGLIAFDAILLSGECVVDETMLTGEAVPVRKVAYSPEADGRKMRPEQSGHTMLYCGTTVAAARPEQPEKQVLAMVTAVGFYTAKGRLVRSILHAKPHDSDFIKQAFLFIAVMLVVAIAFYAWDIAEMVGYGASTADMVLKGLDMITIAVPPALPACLAVATSIVVMRLASKGVHVIEAATINTAGLVDLAAFDKTGTLTESGLCFSGFVPIEGTQVGGSVKDLDDVPDPDVRLAFATCHGLAPLHGQMVGDPLDSTLFEASGYIPMEISGASPSTGLIVHPKDEPVESVEVIRRHDFTPATKRCTAVVADLAGRVHVFVKGAPETLAQMALMVPPGYDFAVQDAALKGMRVIALAKRLLFDSRARISAKDIRAQVSSMSREQLEDGMVLVGLVLMENPLKPDSREVIRDIQAAGIRTMLVTGDHIATSICVSRSARLLDEYVNVLMVDVQDDDIVCYSVGIHSNMVQVGTSGILTAILEGNCQVAVTGRGFRFLMTDHSSPRNKELFEVILKFGIVFARMTPDDKTDLIELLKRRDPDDPRSNQANTSFGEYFLPREPAPTILFCGDGANDLGALRGANVGISLCEAEASVAAPLAADSKLGPRAAITVLSEGRTSLVTSTIIFKYIMIYAFVQVMFQALLYVSGLAIGNYQWLVQDIFHATLLCSAMALTHPAPTLVRARPERAIVSLRVIIPVALLCCVAAGFQLIAFFTLKTRSWYVPFDTATEPTLDASVSIQYPENGTLFLISTWQLLIMAVVLNRGPPFRKPLWTNYYLLACLVLLFGFDLYMLWAPAANDYFLRQVLGICEMPLSFRAELFAIIVGNLIAAFAVDWGGQWVYNWAASKLGFDADVALKPDAYYWRPAMTPSMEMTSQTPSFIE